ncbi:MAG: class I SAM-dependent methyltransferase [Candidatus Pacebacteria bacterium]|nr:class I SAM-dependent methyltransferase [Candidatus Paceibacterota bacterium]
MNFLFKLPLPLKERLFMFVRYLSNPFDEVVKSIIKEKNILDIGCGHGLLEFLLSQKKFSGKITGIDPDRNKIFLARKLFKDNYRNYGFFNEKIETFVSKSLKNKKKFDCITIIDVDYLLNINEKTKLINNVKKLLTKDGLLVMKTVVKRKTFGFYLGYLQELITVFLFRKTFSTESNFYFMSVEQYVMLLEQNGFEVITNKDIRKIYHYHPHHLFLAKIK